MTPDTGQACLNELQIRLLEPPDLGLTWPSGFWSRTEVLWALNHRQQQFLKDTGILAGYALMPAVQGQVTQDLPSDWLDTVAIAFIPTATGSYRPLSPIDGLQADLGLASWPATSGTPLGYILFEGDTLQFKAVPAPDAAGTWEHLYVGQAPDVLADGTPGDLLLVPTEFTPYVLYGTLADLLGKQGRGHDPTRAAHSELRYQEGVTIARLLLYGGD